MQCANHPEVDQDIVRCLRCQQPFCPDCVVLLRGYWYCGPCKDEQVRDIQSGTTTVFELASIGRRFVAVLLDSLIQGAAMMVVMLPFFVAIGGMAALTGAGKEPSDEVSAAMGISVVVMYLVLLLLSIAVPLVYEALMLARRGQTLGKMALSIQVVSVEGGMLTKGQAWGRAGMKVALAQFCSCFGLLADNL
ncbi:MAG TPA: RDD family protein, partial [Vicinamibacteria bacterium]|nr:RDD family protein [Vicinamibacteria bacterium]